MTGFAYALSPEISEETLESEIASNLEKNLKSGVASNLKKIRIQEKRTKFRNLGANGHLLRENRDRTHGKILCRAERCVS